MKLGGLDDVKQMLFGINEHIVGTQLGVFFTRNVRRLPVEQRVAKDLVASETRGSESFANPLCCSEFLNLDYR